MKMKVIMVFSLINILLLIGFYLSLLKPIFDENQKITYSQKELTTTLIKNNQSMAALKQSLNDFSVTKLTKINSLTKTIIKLAKKQNLSLKQIEPILADTAGNPAIGLSIQTNGSYQNSLKFIFYVNQLSFLLHWSNITLARVNKDVELSAIMTRNE